jgi:hypothetical protein
MTVVLKSAFKYFIERRKFKYKYGYITYRLT